MSVLALQKCALFSGLSEEELPLAMAFFHAQQKSYTKGQLLHTPGEALARFGLVLSGNIHVSMVDIHGNPLLMASVLPGDTFGESLCFLKKDSDVIITSMVESEILWLDTEPLKQFSIGSSPLENTLRTRFTAMLSRRILEMNTRIQILSKLTLRDKLTTYFSQCVRMKKSRRFVIPFSREQLASYLGTNRSALSRELSRMQAEGILKYHRNRFEIYQNAEE